jgi:mycothiol S-conjugate amidase
MTHRDTSLRLLAVHANPGDESRWGAATLARYAAAGCEVMVVTCTGADLPAGRAAELATAVEALDVGYHCLGFTGSGFASVPVGEPAEALVRVLREFRPYVVITSAESGEVSSVAFDLAGDRERLPEAGPPWQPLKLYQVHEWCQARMAALHEALLAEGLESPFTAGTAGEERITTRVRCDAYFPLRDRALLAHASQIDPDDLRFAVPPRVQAAAWPTEDFELVRCHVETSLPENDLFAGVPARLNPGVAS